MSIQRGLWLLAILAFSNSAFAQHHPAPRGGGHPGGGVVNPGQQHMMPGGRPMTPQQHQQMMHQQMWNEQLMFESIMNSRGSYNPRRAGAAHSGGGQQPSGNNRYQPNASRQQNGSNSAQPKSNQAKQNLKQQQQKRAESPGNVSKQAKQERENEAKEREAAASKKRHELERLRHLNEKNAIARNRGLQGSDQSMISLLKTAEMKLRRADHDYAGHRVEAMRNVARALEHMSGSYAFNHPGSGLGNLPQAESDRLLREAEGHLRTVESSLGTRTNSAAQHHSARTSVAEAIHHLRIALNIN